MDGLPSQPLPWRAPGTWARLVGVAAAYVLLARLGLAFALSDQVASPIWPPTGLAIAATALWGRRALPAVFLAAWAVEWQFTGNLAVGVALAAGSTLEALVGGWLVRRAGGAAAFQTPAGVQRFAGAVLAAPLVSTAVGVIALLAAGLVPVSAWTGLAWTWYLGDAAGALVVAPVVLLARRPWPSIAARLEILAGLVALAGIAVLTFGAIPGLQAPLPLTVLLLPPLMWLAFRHGALAAALALLALDASVVAATAQGNGPFVAASDNASFLQVQVFVFTLGLVLLNLAALADDRRRTLAQLEDRVLERTARLQGEIEDRRRAEAEVAEAQRVAHLGTWRWDVTQPNAVWSPELFRIYGLDPAKHVPTYDDYLTRVHPDDVERVKAATESVFKDHKSYSHDERIRHSDGTWRHLHTWASAVVDGDGKLIALVGTCQDITERIAQERKFQGLLESAPDAIVITDATGTITLVNSQAERLFGYTRSELLGQAIDLLVPDAARPQHSQHRQDFVAHPTARPMGAGLDLRARRKDGSLVPVEISLSPLETPDGVLVSSAIRDVTARKKAEHALAESLERFRALSDASPIGIVHTTPEGSVDYANKAWMAITGVADFRDDKAVRAAIHPEDQPTMRALWDACARQGREFAAEMRFIHPDGAVRLTACRAVPVHDLTGAITGFVSAVEDITERRAAERAYLKEQEARLQVERLREQAEFKTNFLRTAAHELGTPLTPIKLQLRVLGHLIASQAAPEQAKAVAILDRNVDRLQVLVRELLDSARLQSGRLKLNLRDTDLRRIIDDVLDTFRQPAVEAGIALTADLDGPLTLTADPDRVSQVLYNLLSNAVKFTPAGGRIEVHARTNPQDILLRVTDNGPGFTAEQASRLFQPFSQVHDPMQSSKPGSGLGLYICKGIVEQHGGHIEARSQGPGQGATVTVTLPRQPPAGLPAEPVPNEPPTGHPGA